MLKRDSRGRRRLKPHTEQDVGQLAIDDHSGDTRLLVNILCMQGKQQGQEKAEALP